MLSVHWSHVTGASVLLLLVVPYFSCTVFLKSSWEKTLLRCRERVPELVAITKSASEDSVNESGWKKIKKIDWKQPFDRFLLTLFMYYIRNTRIYICTQIQVYISINETSVIYTFSFSFLAPLSSLSFRLIHYAQRKRSRTDFRDIIKALANGRAGIIG